jgi:hypothetical protein
MARAVGVRYLWSLTFTFVFDLTEFHVPQRPRGTLLGRITCGAQLQKIHSKAATRYSLLTMPLG